MKELIEKLLSLSGEDFKKDRILDILKSKNDLISEAKKFEYFEKGNYTRNLLCKNKNFELVLLCWEPGHITPIHDHSRQKCWMTVLEGIIATENFEFVPPSEFNGALQRSSVECFTPGEAYYIDDDISLHLLKNPIKNNQRTLTLHLYSKPYSSCTAYDLDKKEIKELEFRYHSVGGQVKTRMSRDVVEYTI